ncbi:ABC transporter substrate-binding protein [Bradyrhizobium canariense]|uniref:ABC transporter substrate-binding protein n=1 Tax=Bradyrhizobium canariense TaxID=255045 RepID=UPI0011BA85B0|nr:ABC transporter substrate-binding protein [Bradyrhizobium canariense]
MKRRWFIALLGGAIMAAPRVAFGQSPTKVYRLAMLSPGVPSSDMSPDVKLLLASLARYGYVLGQNLELEGPRGRFAEFSALPQLLGDLKAAKVDVVVTIGYPTAIAAKQSGISTVVAYGAGDPVATGLVDHLDRPGGTITGISDVASTLTTKRLGLLKQLAPGIRRVAVMWNKDDLGMTLRYDASVGAAQAFGITIQPASVRKPDDFNQAFAMMDCDRPDALLMVSDLLTNVNVERVFDYTKRRSIPSIYEYDVFAREGGLMSYGPDLKESFDRAASLVDRIFKGARPGELPFEQPTRYLFVLNLKTAKAMKLEVPPSLLALADEVIE